MKLLLTFTVYSDSATLNSRLQAGTYICKKVCKKFVKFRDHIWLICGSACMNIIFKNFNVQYKLNEINRFPTYTRELRVIIELTAINRNKRLLILIKSLE